MTENKFEPAKILSKPDPKPNEKATAQASPKTAEPIPAAISAAQQPGSSGQPENDGDSFKGILDRFTGKDKGAVVWASPYDMSKNGAFNGLYKSNVDRVARDIQGIVIATIFHAYLLIGSHSALFPRCLR